MSIDERIDALQNTKRFEELGYKQKHVKKKISRYVNNVLLTRLCNNFRGKRAFTVKLLFVYYSLNSWKSDKFLLEINLSAFSTVKFMAEEHFFQEKKNNFKKSILKRSHKTKHNSRVKKTVFQNQVD